MIKDLRGWIAGRLLYRCHRKNYYSNTETFEKPGDFHHPQKDNGLF